VGGIMINIIKAKHVNLVRIETIFEAVCPITKTVDRYELVLTYIPGDGEYIELESFKKFLESFKGVEVFHEDLAYRIAEEVCKTAKPKEVTVELRSIFMGMKVTVVKEMKCKI
jgi:NADPH-dependent 7-cyano-7-deazaguanine reductase QueF